MNILNTRTSSSPPASVTPFSINLIGIILFFVFLLIVRHAFPTLGLIYVVALCLAATAIFLCFYDWKYLRVYQRPSTQLSHAREINLERVIIKLTGLYGTFLIIAGGYWLAPVYRVSPAAAAFYGNFFEFLGWFVPLIILLSPLYFIEVDRRQKEPHDSYWHMGCLVLGRWKNIDTVILQEHARVWFIKGFFTPFMFALTVMYINIVLAWKWDHSFYSLYDYLLNLFYTVDVIYGVLGYILTFRLIDTHIQSTEPTLWGWLVCLICYSPFDKLPAVAWLAYDDGFNWNHWYSFTPVSYYVCGISIIVLTLIYALATVAFGYRSSNMTYRGLISSGPYRYTKHPAYVCKVASWWLISLPFFSVQGPLVAIKGTLALLGMTVVYYLRAKTEENHLSSYPEYVQYANWINDHGVLRLVGKFFPYFRYSEEKAKRWKSVVWFKQTRQQI